MAYTTEDIAKIESAILDLATRARAVRVTQSDGKSVEWAQADIAALKALKNEIEISLGLICSRVYARNVRRR